MIFSFQRYPAALAPSPRERRRERARDVTAGTGGCLWMLFSLALICVGLGATTYLLAMQFLP